METLVCRPSVQRFISSWSISSITCLQITLDVYHFVGIFLVLEVTTCVGHKLSSHGSSGTEVQYTFSYCNESSVQEMQKPQITSLLSSQVLSLHLSHSFKHSCHVPDVYSQPSFSLSSKHCIHALIYQARRMQGQVLLASLVHSLMTQLYSQ